jgi:hypothetical protein
MSSSCLFACPIGASNLDSPNLSSIVQISNTERRVYYSKRKITDGAKLVLAAFNRQSPSRQIHNLKIGKPRLLETCVLRLVQGRTSEQSVCPPVA